MPAPVVFSSSQSHVNAAFPALYLYPLNASFVPKHILLHNSQRVKIGRQTNAKTVPAERNGYFDSKVLSRQHAEVWEENGKIFIKDVKSSNGTFINGERLSAEGFESEPTELKSDDIVEFGIDIVGEDNKTIIHHKVAARVVCVLSEQDVQMAARAEAQQQQAQQSSSASLSQTSLSPSGPSNFHQPVFGFQGGRRPPTQPQLGGMGGSMRPPGSSKSGLTVDHILSRLQGELQKSRDTSAELNNLTGAISEIGDVLSGNTQNPPPYPQALPSVRPTIPPLQTEPPPTKSTPQGASLTTPFAALASLQSQLQATQSSLASQHDKICALEGVLQEHEAVKIGLSILKEAVESMRTDGDCGVSEESEDDAVLEDDGRSINTITRLESVQEEEEDRLDESTSGTFSSSFPQDEKLEDIEVDENDEGRQKRRDALGRPRTPEPSSLGLDFRIPLARPKISQPHSPTSSVAFDELNQRLSALSSRLESALELSSTLQAQHTEAQGTIKALEEKIEQLEGLVHNVSTSIHHQSSISSPTAAPAAEAPRDSDRENLMQLLASFQKSVEGQWSSFRLEWKEERERLSRARDEFDAKLKVLEVDIQEVHSFRSLTKAVAPLAMSPLLANGDVKGGLVTPPSPRSLSSDSSTSRRRRRGRSSKSGSRGRVRSASPATSATMISEIEEAGESSMPPDQGTSDNSKRCVFPITPDASVRLGDSTTDSVASSASINASPGEKSLTANNQQISDMHLRNVSTAVGVIVLGVAAAAVLWRVKAE